MAGAVHDAQSHAYEPLILAKGGTNLAKCLPLCISVLQLELVLLLHTLRVLLWNTFGQTDPCQKRPAACAPPPWLPCISHRHSKLLFSPVGYTPLHMASGYMHTAAMAALLEAAADPQLKDNNGRDVVQLVDGLRAQMPLNPTTITRRIALEQVAGVLSERVYEEVQPAQVCSRGWFG